MRILLIGHRFPYPPDRGEKIRLWHVLQHLARTHRVFLGCLSDDPRDAEYRPQIEALCARLGCFDIDKRRQKILALARARPGRPLMLDYYRHAPLQRWIAGLVARERIDLVYIFSTAMAPYALDLPALRAVPTILDMVDVDSEKWADYARKTSGPARLVWAREARTLRTYERRATAACARTLLVTDAECRCLVARAPESAAKILALENGVDLDFFAPAGDAVATPYPAAGPWLTLVGNFDYWPNQDAAIWFARDVLPRLRTGRGPGGSATAKLALVGANPSRSILDLAAPDVLVTGRVADIRPWLAHAAAVVAPLRIARGVQNKVLEAMAAGRPVVASPQACLGIAAEPGRDLLVADGAAEMAGRIAEVLDGQHPGLGAAGRQAVQRYAWPLRLAQLDAILADLRPDLAVR